MQNPIVSVIMPVYNAEKYILKAVESILNQSFQNLELIIIDDHGTDNSIEIVKEIKDHRIRIIDNKINMGIAYSRNEGIKNAIGKYIALMDDDDIAPLNRLQMEVDYLDSHPDIDVVAGGELWINEDDEIISYYDQVICNPKRIKAELLFQDVIENGSAMFRKDFVIEKDIKYRDGFLGMEDYKFWTECSAKGKIANVSDVLLYWRKTETSETSRVKTELKKEREKKFAQIQIDLLKMYGFVLSEDEYSIFTRCFMEDKSKPLNREELNDVFLLIKKLICLARESKVDNYTELVQVLKRRFAQKLEYSSLWNDDIMLLCLE